MKKPSIIFLGASTDQAPSYRAARDLGLHIIGFDANPNAYAFKFADEVHICSVRDYEKITEILGGRHIDGIYSQASDAGRMSEYCLSKVFNTPRPVSIESVKASMDKAYLLNILEEIGLPFQRHICSDDLPDIKRRVSSWAYPFVVKPNDSSGSKGVRTIYSEGELEAALTIAQGYSQTKTVMCEELVSGVHYSADALIRNSEVEYITVSKKIMTNPPAMVPLHYLMPADIPEPLYYSILKHVELMCRGLKIVAGPITCDLVVTENGAVHFIEMGARAGGNGISILMQGAFGANYIQASVALHVGENIPVALQYKKCAALMALTSAVSGRLQSIDGLETLQQENYIVDHEVFYQQGDEVERFENGSHKLGYVVLQAETNDSLLEKIERVRESIKINVECENSISTNSIL